MDGHNHGPSTAKARSAPAATRRLLPHAATVTALFVALLLATPTGDIASPDEGLYLAQVEALSSGGWWVDRALPAAPEATYADGLVPEITAGGRMVPYARHPLLPVLFTPFFMLGGPTGALVLSLLALLVAALAAGRISASLDRRAEVPAFYLVALGSPLTFSGWQVSGHSIAAAVVALGALAALRFLQHGAHRWLIAMALATATCAMVRSEGQVLCAVVALCFVGAGTAASIRARSVHRLAIIGGIVALSTAGALLIEQRWFDAITGAHGTAGGLDRARSIDQAPASAAWNGLLKPWHGSGTTANTFLILAGIALVGAAVARRALPTRPLAAIALLALSVASAVGSNAVDPTLVNGFLPAFPVLLAAFVLLRLDAVRNPVVLGLLATSGTTAVALCLLIYEDGGAAQWGGRFFHLLIPLLAPVVALVGVREFSTATPRSRLALTVAVGCVALLITAVGMRTQRVYRDLHRDMRLAAERHVPKVPSGISDRSVLVVATPGGDGLSRIFWRDEPSFAVLHSSSVAVFPSLRPLATRGLDSVYVLTVGDGSLMEFAGRNDLADMGWSRLEDFHVPGMSIHIIRYGTDGSTAN